jgi:CTP:molybdopterin cytidylyltransferase MocA
VIAAVVLAAGSGSRFGESAKQLAELDGKPLLEHALRAVEGVPAIDRIVVVLGARADEIRAGVDFGAAEVVVCEDWADGQAASLRRGIQAVADDADAVVITLGDMPRITSSVIAQFADLARRDGAQTRVRAVYDGRPGHPVALGSDYFAQLTQLHGDAGARQVMKSIGVETVECGGRCDATDVDTPEVLERLRG